MLSNEEKAKRYDELQSWFWWLKRRTHDGKTPKSVMAIFLQGISKIFDDYKEEGHEK
jgi:hypothetical protein